MTLTSADAELHVRLGGESRAAKIVIRGGELASRDLLVHFALPAARAWNNVVHCATVQPFARADCR